MQQKKHQLKRKHFYGTANLGEKGQVVIPNDARKALKLSKGDRLLVFGIGDDMVAFVKLSHIEKIVSHLAERLKMIDEIIKKTK